MQLSRHFRRRVALLVSMMLMTAALMPTLAHAFGFAGGNGWGEICTAQGGIKKVPVVQTLDDAAERDLSTFSSALNHCPYCLWASHSPAVPTYAITLSAPTAAHPVPGEPFWQAFRTSHVWRPAQSRAPPISS